MKRVPLNQLLQCMMGFNPQGHIWETEQNTNLRGEGAGGLTPLPKSQCLRPSGDVHSPVLLSSNVHVQSSLPGSGKSPQVQRCRRWQLAAGGAPCKV